MLRNPTYKGMAAFGRTKVGPRLASTRLIDRRLREETGGQPKNNWSKYKTDKEDWIYIPVPAILDEALFDAVQEQLIENKKLSRVNQEKASYLLQGLIVCQRCQYGFYGRPSSGKKNSKCDHGYYRCTGTDSYRFGGNKICDNKPIRTDTLEASVWEEVKNLLKDPNRILDEYQRRISELGASPLDQTVNLLDQQEAKMKKMISRLIDSYAQEYIDKNEFEPRIKEAKQRLKSIEEQKRKVMDQKNLKNELTLLVTNLEHFSFSIKSNLEAVDWNTKRDIIRMLVKKVEINLDEINIVFRIKELPGMCEKHGGTGSAGEGHNQNCKHCLDSTY
jgi:site-specific DNA recombinase